jgi:hypothetical protein
MSLVMAYFQIYGLNPEHTALLGASMKLMIAYRLQSCALTINSQYRRHHGRSGGYFDGRIADERLMHQGSSILPLSEYASGILHLKALSLGKPLDRATTTIFYMTCKYITLHTSTLCTT